ncbi:MAG: single-stranded-DNA-specific exonuclease RecJ [Clostridia bacterium]|nr:single-stranded-DNA-specific exonuclease RecJ [Clostridia bacterium]
MQKVWNVRKYDEEYIDRISKKYNIPTMLAKLIDSRQVEFNDIEIFLRGSLENLSDPYIIKDMDRFVERVDKAVKAGEKIVIYGDYDVDGVTSITIMYEFLRQLGANVVYYLPDRLTEGYGLNREAIVEMKNSGVSLIITVDCGITAIEETIFARELGIDICITDHHECSSILPSAYAVVNPKRHDDTSTFKMYAGVGVAFKCISALAIKYNMDIQSYMKYIDIVAIGTISDIVSLVGENRIIAKYGLELLSHTDNVGLQTLLNIIGSKSIDSMLISFGIAPRINACGRMGSAKIAVELLLEQDRNKAFKIANELEELNKQRQLKEKEIFNQALDMINNEHLENKNVIVLWDKSWHSGVLGIVASRLVSMYSKPVILFTMEDNVAKGSGRCQIGFSLYEALNICKSDIIQFGGHELAAGLTVEINNLENFRDSFEKCVGEILNNNIVQIVDVDDEITKEDLNKNLINSIRSLKPYGQGNKVPLFLYKDLKIKSIRTVKDNKHLKFTLYDRGACIDAIAFSKGQRRDELLIGDKIDVICNVDLNEYNVPKTVQLIIQDFKKSI